MVGSSGLLLCRACASVMWIEMRPCIAAFYLSSHNLQPPAWYMPAVPAVKGACSVMYQAGASKLYVVMEV